jgi:general secretion pathway protein I
MRRDTAPAGQRGFTLLEVLIAFIIAALALGVMFNAVLGGLRASTEARRYQEAVSLARSHLAEITPATLGRRELQGDDGRGFGWHMRIVPAGSAALARSPAMEAADAPVRQAMLYAVSVIEQWREDGGTRQVRLDSARLGPGPGAGLGTGPGGGG